MTQILRKRDLKKSLNLKKKFNLINQHLYAKLKYTDTDTRTRSKEIVNLLLCKLFDEISKSDDDLVDFCIKNNESEQELADRIQNIFIENVKEKYSDIIEDNEQIRLNKELIYLIVKELQDISLLESSRDILSDAFEIFVSKILKDEAGQFFTPPNIIRFMVSYLKPTLDSNILDPACGHGGFLLEVKTHLWNLIEMKYKGDEDMVAMKKEVIISHLYGIDKDSFLSKICKLYLEILSGGKSFIYCEDSLDFTKYRQEAKLNIKNEKFDYILTNPPFGSKIPIDNKEILKNFKLGHIWKLNENSQFKIQKKIIKQQPPQILFIERCIQLLNDGGKLGIVLPEGIFGNPSNRYIWEYLRQNGKILGIISLNQNTFQPYTCNKTSILFFEKLKNIPHNYLIDFAIVDNVGHDKDGKDLYMLNRDGTKQHDNNGNPIINDELIDLHSRLSESKNYLEDQKTFKIPLSQIKNNIFIPYYYTGVERQLKLLSEDRNFKLYTIKELIQKNIIFSNKNGHLPRGDEIGSHVYGLGEIPFIRTSEIFEWSINLDSHKKTSQEVYDQYKLKQNIEVGDIIIVKDGGPNLIGKNAYITELDTNIIIQSHIFQIKIIKNDASIDSFLLLYLLNLDIVQKQIEAITFIQGTIATIGNRIMEVYLPIPTNIEKRKEISQFIKKIISNKMENKKLIQNLSIQTFFK